MLLILLYIYISVNRKRSLCFYSLFNSNKISLNSIALSKSKFLAYKIDLTSLEDVKKTICELKKEHKKATHICYAYVYKNEVISEKCCDDGEPGGTAGYPILNVIKKKNLTNVMVAVVRYFGGIKLGAGGLTRAYTKACAGVLD